MRAHRSNRSRGVGIAVEQLAALAAAAGMTMLLLCAMAFLLTKLDAGRSVFSAVSTGALAIGAYFGGYVGGRRRKSRGLAMGALTGLLIFLLILVLSSIFVKTAENFSPFAKLFMTVFAAAVGGAVGVNTKRTP
ncbi:TIGR04086 family membrane protein [Ruminococcus sp.]|uniref:TIGR04086 family membrane protein n=1 Tax=Ruminococcus sp. TaxID=41978 RepID=UPI001B027CF7|nr:TIGR04086 family membrane protein [Ruminococcus sp.]MBE6872883.1 TIGR04086 family membrane protein [Ruminococcus albus]MBO5559889.1 TIGR04086 family membrane protein [Ruminococcus sp.]MBQ9541535.1 TIGR04086 family membrane protein [Ruminococcus sp.]MBR0530902.1 TIGR04086 family membrane protein [Ruminococcus sp.]